MMADPNPVAPTMTEETDWIAASETIATHVTPTVAAMMVRDDSPNPRARCDCDVGG